LFAGQEISQFFIRQAQIQALQKPFLFLIASICVLLYTKIGEFSIVFFIFVNGNSVGAASKRLFAGPARYQSR
jgi:hypothetical protein